LQRRTWSGDNGSRAEVHVYLTGRKTGCLLRQERKKMRKQKRFKTLKPVLCAGLFTLFTMTMPMTALADTVYVNASKLNYRSQPSTASGKVLGTLSRGTEVSRVKNNGEWSEIQVGGSKTTVYVASRYLTASKPQAGNGSTSTAAGGTAAVSADGTGPGFLKSVRGQGMAGRNELRLEICGFFGDQQRTCGLLSQWNSK